MSASGVVCLGGRRPGGVYAHEGCLPGGCLPGGSAPVHAGIHTPLPCGQNPGHTLVKTLPFSNYVAKGKNRLVLPPLGLRTSHSPTATYNIPVATSKSDVN